MLRQRQNNQPAELAKALRGLGLGSQDSLWNCLLRIERPLLLLTGALDRKFIAINVDMLARCPPARFKLIADCGHNAHLENASVYAQAAIDFLSNGF